MLNERRRGGDVCRIESVAATVAAATVDMTEWTAAASNHSSTRLSRAQVLFVNGFFETASSYGSLTLSVLHAVALGEAHFLSAPPFA